MSLNSQYELAPIGELQPKPTLLHSALESFEKPFYEVGLATSVIGEKLSPGLSSEDYRKRMAEKIEVINNNLSDPRAGTVQTGFNYASNFIGSLAPLAPLGIVGGAIGKFALGASGIVARSLAPEAFISLANKPFAKMVAGEYAHYFPLIGETTAAKTTNAAVQAYTAYKGAVIPEHIVENYHKENDTLDSRQAIQDWSADNYGFLIPTASLAAGYVLFKAAKIPGVKRARHAEIRKLEEEHRLQKQKEAAFKEEVSKKEERQITLTNLEKNLNEAVEKNRITSRERDWYIKYLENPNDHETLFESSKKILEEAQIPYDRITGHHLFQILDSNDVANLKAAIADQAATNFSAEEAQVLSNYIIHNRMDVIRSLLSDNPNILHGLQGYTAFIDSKLANKDKHFKALDKIITEHLPKGLHKFELFSQKNIYQHLRKNKIKSSEVPYMVPRQVAEKLRLESKINKLISKKNEKFKTVIEELKKQVKEFKLLTPEQELNYLKETLLPENKLRKNYKNHEDFHRLKELSEVWANAKHLLDRINMEADYARQAAFNSILKRFVDMVDSNATRLANPLRVTEYIKRRVEAASPELRESKLAAAIIHDEVKETFLGGETKREGNLKVIDTEKSIMIFDSLKKQIEEFGSDTDKEEFGFIEARYNQLKDNESALAELIECALGGING